VQRSGSEGAAREALNRTSWQQLGPEGRERVRQHLRTTTIERVLTDARCYDDDGVTLLLEMVGFNVATSRVTRTMEIAAIEATLPLLDDNTLRLLLAHVDEVRDVGATAEVQ
jgi:hypothetical protein